jgi:DNA-binding response OmpR family regulator
LALVTRLSLFYLVNLTHLLKLGETPTFGEPPEIAHCPGSRRDDVAAPIQDQNKLIDRILVVDDDPVCRQFYADALIDLGYQVDTAEDGGVGWEALHSTGYNLLITDNQMPKVSGVELVKLLRSARMDVPVVLASSAIPTEEIHRNPSLRLAGTLLKPFTIGELLAMVKKVLGAVDDSRNRTAMRSAVLAVTELALPNTIRHKEAVYERDQGITPAKAG